MYSCQHAHLEIVDYVPVIQYPINVDMYILVECQNCDVSTKTRVTRYDKRMLSYKRPDTTICAIRNIT